MAIGEEYISMQKEVERAVKAILYMDKLRDDINEKLTKKWDTLTHEERIETLAQERMLSQIIGFLDGRSY